MLRFCVVSGRGFIQITGHGEEHNLARTTSSPEPLLFPFKNRNKPQQKTKTPTTFRLHQEEATWKRSEVVRVGAVRVYICLLAYRISGRPLGLFEDTRLTDFYFLFFSCDVSLEVLS